MEYNFEALQTSAIENNQWTPRTIAGGDWDIAGKRQMMNHNEAKLEFIHNAIDNGATEVKIIKKRKLCPITKRQLFLKDIVPNHYKLSEAEKSQALFEIIIENNGKGMSYSQMQDRFGKQGNDEGVVRNNGTLGHYKRGAVMAMETLNWDCGVYSCSITSIKGNTKSEIKIGSKGICKGKIEKVHPGTQEGTSIYLPCVAESINHYSFIQELSVKLYPVKKTKPEFKLRYVSDSEEFDLEFSDPMYNHLKNQHEKIVHRSFHKGKEKELKSIGILSVDSTSFYKEISSLKYALCLFDRQKKNGVGSVIDSKKSGYYITFVNDNGIETTLACGYEHGGRFINQQTDKTGLRVHIRINKDAFRLFGIATNKSHMKIDWEEMRLNHYLLFQILQEVNAFHTSGSDRVLAKSDDEKTNENLEIETFLAKYIGVHNKRITRDLQDENLNVDTAGKVLARNLIQEPNGSFYSLTKKNDCIVLSVNTSAKQYEVYDKLTKHEKAIQDLNFLNTYQTNIHMLSMYPDRYDDELMHEYLAFYQSEMLRTIYKA